MFVCIHTHTPGTVVVMLGTLLTAATQQFLLASFLTDWMNLSKVVEVVGGCTLAEGTGMSFTRLYCERENFLRILRSVGIVADGEMISNSIAIAYSLTATSLFLKLWKSDWVRTILYFDVLVVIFSLFSVAFYKDIAPSQSYFNSDTADLYGPGFMLQVVALCIATLNVVVRFGALEYGQASPYFNIVYS